MPFINAEMNNNGNDQVSPLISFRLVAASAFPASSMFLNWTKANPRFFPSIQKQQEKNIRVALEEV